MFDPFMQIDTQESDMLDYLDTTGYGFNEGFDDADEEAEEIEEEEENNHDLTQQSNKRTYSYATQTQQRSTVSTLVFETKISNLPITSKLKINYSITDEVMTMWLDKLDDSSNFVCINNSNNTVSINDCIKFLNVITSPYKSNADVMAEYFEFSSHENCVDWNHFFEFVDYILSIQEIDFVRLEL